MKRVLLTGAGGAIGVHMLAHIMHNTDWEVVATDSFNTKDKGYFDRITRVCRNHPDWPSRIKVIVHDLRTPITVREATEIGPVHYIINLASRSDVHASIFDQVDFVQNNVNLMLNMLQYARELPHLEAFLHFSTDEVYGPTDKDGKGHPEWDAIVPSNPYSASKACQEALAIAWWRCYGIPLIITNTMNNFGEMQAPSKYPAMIQNNIQTNQVTKVHTNSKGESGTRYYLHSRNAADAVLTILQKVKPVLHEAGEIDRPVRLNIVGDQQVGNEEMVHIISELMGKPAVFEHENYHDNNPGHDAHYGLDGTKLAELGWKAPVPFKESLKNTIEWQQRNPEWL